jgi:hypothetical protein
MRRLGGQALFCAPLNLSDGCLCYARTWLVCILWKHDVCKLQVGHRRHPLPNLDAQISLCWLHLSSTGCFG